MKRLMNVQCLQCGRVFSLAVDLKAYEEWKFGKLIQDCFPEMTADERELLISRTCGECFDEIFSEDAYEKQDY